MLHPILAGSYYGYLATGESRWIDRLISCTDAWIRRGVKEPDGYLGWPKLGAAGTDVDHLDDFYADSMLGEAMALQPVVLMASVIIKTPYACGEISGVRDQGHMNTLKFPRRFSINGTAGEPGARPTLAE